MTQVLTTSPEGVLSRAVNLALQLDSLLTGALHQTLVICDVDPEFGTSESLALGT